jgi:alpha-tubulin suppressor-like RCC1 family protein
VARSHWQERFACVLSPDGKVDCQGKGSWGQVASEEAWAPVEGLSDVRELAASAYHVCAMTRSDDLYCWGKNEFGESSGMAPQPLEPLAPVEGLPPIARLAALGNRTCAEDRRGATWCWGSGGVDSRPPVSIPPNPVVPETSFSPRPCTGMELCEEHDLPEVPLENLPETPWPPVLTKVRGTTHECGLTPDGAVLCHGFNGFGQLGRPDPSRVSRPVRVHLPDR